MKILNSFKKITLITFLGFLSINSGNSQMLRSSSTPNDPLLFANNSSPHHQYHLNVSNGDLSIDFPSTWQYARGHALVGILDLQVNGLHPDITGNIRLHLTNLDLLVDEPDSVNGIYFDHASWVVGVIAPSTDNNEGLAGVCQNCSLIQGNTSLTNLASPISLVQNGVQAINLSFGGDEKIHNCDIYPNMCSLYENLMVERDIVLVAVSQNRYGENGPFGVASPMVQNTFPGSHPNFIQVGGLNESLEYWNDCEEFEGQSTCGSLASPYQELVAPAKNILTAITYTVDGLGSCGIINNPPLLFYDICSGNSFAAPQVTGLVAILRSIYPQLSANNIRLLLQKTAQSPFQERTQEWGYGLINPLESVKIMLGVVSGIQQTNRSIPFFGIHNSDETAFSTSPQFIAAALAGDLRGQVNAAYIPLELGMALNDYQIPASNAIPYAAFHILGTHNNPLIPGKELIQLYRLSKATPDSTDFKLDHAYVTEPYINQFEAQGYMVDTIEGYIFPPCDSTDTSCAIPEFSECLIARNNSIENPDWVILLESQLAHNSFKQYNIKLSDTEDICLGYAYKSIDTDNDGLIDGYENFLGTNINQADSDNDGESDGQEMLVMQADATFSDPISNNIPFEINAGLTGAWYYPETTGQGFLLDIIEETAQKKGEIFAAWFTYDLVESENSTDFGNLNNRWFTAFGEYDQDKSILTIYESEGGQFDDPATVTNIAVGKLEIRFSDCSNAVVSYSFDNTAIRGSFPLSRITADQFCNNQNTKADIESNGGLSGSWFNPVTSGQGILFDVIQSQGKVFAAWFTYGTDNNPISPDFGAANQRWFTAFGDWNDNGSQMTVYSTQGGVFDTPTSVNNQEVGSMNVIFESCISGTVTYEFPEINLTGSFPIQRITPNVYCQDN